jgi:hypothetical protein
MGMLSYIIDRTWLCHYPVIVFDDSGIADTP